MMIRLLLFSPLFLLVLSVPAFAHDCWLAPQSFSLVQGALLMVSLCVGDRFAPEKILPLDKKLTSSFKLHNNGKETDLLEPARQGDDPVLTREITKESGEILISMERDFTDITLPDEKFSQYLEHEHQEKIIELRRAGGHRKEERERYARCIKSLVLKGEPGDDGIYNKILGQKLEIVLEDNPYTLKKNEKIRAMVLFNGAPLSDKTVTAYQKIPTGEVFSFASRTDNSGQADFEVTGPGIWMIRLVHLIPSPDKDRADWLSFWAAYNFEISER